LAGLEPSPLQQAAQVTDRGEQYQGDNGDMKKQQKKRNECCATFINSDDKYNNGDSRLSYLNSYK